MRMTIPLVHLNRNNFPESDQPLPQRSIDNPQISRYLVVFSRGPRDCIGITYPGLSYIWSYRMCSVVTISLMPRNLRKCDYIRRRKTM